MIDVVALLERLGIEPTGQTGDEIQAHCPGHEERTGKADDHPSWSINAETGAHLCFSCQYRGGLATLVATVNGYGWDDAEAYLRDLQSHEARAEDVLRMMQQVRERPAHEPETVWVQPESALALFVSPPSWALRARRLTGDAAEEYGVLWDHRRDLWITPLRERYTGRLLGWQEKGQTKRFFNNRPKGMQKSKTLFGWHAAIESDTAVVVESPLDAVRLASAGVPGAMAFCGAKVSDEQYELLRHFRKIVVAFDNPKVDAAGRQAAHAMRKEAKARGLPVHFFAYGDTETKDVGDMTDKRVWWGLDNAVHWMFGPKAVAA